MAELLVEVTRGSLVESCHYGHIAVVNSQGEVICSVGDPQMVTYLRSAAKPLQALPVVKSGAFESFSLTNKHLAVMTGSHTGERIHCLAVQEILNAIGVETRSLQCGRQWPANKKVANELILAEQEPSPLHNNCSGKHAGMLLLAKYHGWPMDTYWKVNHPVQEKMLKEVAEICSYQQEKISQGVDGCGVPVFAMPLKNMAQGFANLVSKKENNQIVTAMISYPEMVFGPGKLDTVLMQTAGNLVAKTGAEAVYCIGLIEHGLGIAIKITDGSLRALDPTVVQVLAQLDVLSPTTLEKLAKFHTPPVKNRRQEIVGELRPVFKL